MRILLAALLFTGCVAGRGDHGGAAWPKPSDPETDGGESLAPHPAQAIVADGAGGDADPETAVDKPVAADKPATAAPTVSAPTAGAPATPDDTLFGDDDMTIEVTD